jgi:hypothetical protein
VNSRIKKKAIGSRDVRRPGMQLPDAAPASQVGARRSGTVLGAKIYSIKVSSTSAPRLRLSHRSTLTLTPIALAPIALAPS